VTMSQSGKKHALNLPSGRIASSKLHGQIERSDGRKRDSNPETNPLQLGCLIVWQWGGEVSGGFVL